MPDHEPTTQGFRDLRVWQSAMSLVESVYLLTRSFPREEVYGLTLQLRRPAVSVPSNSAEGQARQHLREHLHHLSMAQGSLGELETQTEIAQRLGHAASSEAHRVLDQRASVSRQLRAIRIALERRYSGLQKNGADSLSGAGPQKPEPRT